MATNLMSGPFAKLAGVFDDLVTLSADQIAMTNVPDFLKIAAINAQAQTRNTPVSPPQSTVADDLLAGVGALQTSPDQFGDRYYNRGGIVSFSDGGSTIQQQITAIRNRQPPVGATAAERELFDLAKQKEINDLYKELRGVDIRGPQIKSERQRAIHREWQKEEVPPLFRIPGTREEEMQRLEEEIALSKQLEAGLPRDVAKFNIGEYGEEKPITSMDELSGLFSEKIPKRTPGKKPPMTPDSAISFTPRALMRPVEDIVGPVGGASLDPEDYKIEYVPIQPSERKTPEQIVALRAQDLAAAGVDPAKRMAEKRERLSKLEERFAEETKQAPWLALMQAGLKMAQTPGSFGQALAAGAQTGLADYLRAKKDLTESEQALLDRQDALDDLEYATKVEDVNAIRDERARADEEDRRLREINTQGENAVIMHNQQIAFKAREAQLAQQGRMQDLKALYEYRLADLTKDYAMLQVTYGKAVMDANVDMVNAANTGRLTENQMLEYLKDRAEEIRTDPTFLDTYFKDKPSTTEEEINAQAMRVAQRDLAQTQYIIAGQREVSNKLRSLYGLGSLGTTGFFVTPASK